MANESENYLLTDDVIVLHGAHQVGKTSLMTQYKGRTYKVVGLNHEPKDEQQVYPWDI